VTGRASSLLKQFCSPPTIPKSLLSGTHLWASHSVAVNAKTYSSYLLSQLFDLLLVIVIAERDVLVDLEQAEHALIAAEIDRRYLT